MPCSFTGESRWLPQLAGSDPLVKEKLMIDAAVRLLFRNGEDSKAFNWDATPASLACRSNVKYHCTTTYVHWHPDRWEPGAERGQRVETGPGLTFPPQSLWQTWRRELWDTNKFDCRYGSRLRGSSDVSRQGAKLAAKPDADELLTEPSKGRQPAALWRCRSIAREFLRSVFAMPRL